MRIDDRSREYTFCPGKATWYEDVAELYTQCRVALETGILPKAGALADQDADFVEAFYPFIDRWRERTYGRIWSEVHDYVEQVLKAIFGKGK